MDSTVNGEHLLDPDHLLLLEARLLDKESVDNIWSDLTQDELTQLLRRSPLLARAHGELCMRGGRLRDACRSLELAIRGFAVLAMTDGMLSAIALLARALLRSGRYAEAEAPLRFLREELREAAPCGQMLWTLAQGAHLLGETDWSAADHYYRQAILLLEREGDADQLAAIRFDRLYKLAPYLDDGQWEAELYRFRRSCASAYAYGRGGDAAADSAEALEAAEAAALLQAVRLRCSADRAASGSPLPPGGKPGKRWLGTAHGRLRDALRRAVEAAAALHSSEAPHAPLSPSLSFANSSSEPDIELEFELVCAEYAIHAAGRDEQRLRSASGRLNTLLEEGAPPAYRVYVEALRRAADPCASPDAGASASATANPRGLPPPEADNDTLRVEWFNGLRLIHRGKLLTDIHWKRKKALELFLLLLDQPRYTADKEWAADILFEREQPEKTANQLYVAVHTLRRALSEATGHARAVSTDNGAVRLDEQLFDYFDIEKYFTLARVGHHLWVTDRELAVELYEDALQMYGPVLPELQFADWLQAVRDRVAEQQTYMQMRLARHYTSGGQLDRAVHYYTLEAMMNPLNEDAVQQLMRLLLRQGKKAEARAWYERLERACAIQLDTTPMKETKQMLTE